MEIFPQNLRADQHAQMVYVRSTRGIAQPGERGMPLEPPPPKLGALGRLWARGTGLSDQQAARANPAVSTQTQGATWGVGLIGSMLSGLAALIVTKKTGLDPAAAWALWGGAAVSFFGLGAGPWARYEFRRLHQTPLTASEIDALLERAPTDLDRTFLSLVRDVVRTPLPDPPASQVRNSIAALAEALDALPEVSPSAVDTVALRADAEALEQQALHEPDRVTSDSLSRRADALRRRAGSADLSALAGKRAQALRAELQAQMEALREGLVALSADSARGALADLSQLAESVRRVAAEAASSRAAEDEVAGLLRTPPPVEPQAQTLRRGG